MDNSSENSYFDLDMKPYQLFSALYNVKGNADASAYERNVCKYYETEIIHKFESLNFNCMVSIPDHYALESAINNYNSFLDLAAMLYNGVDEGLNFKLLNIPYGFVNDICSPAFTAWVESAKNAVSTLPKTEIILGKFFLDNPINLLFYRSSIDFVVPNKDVSSLESALNINEQESTLLRNRYKWELDLVSYLENYNYFDAQWQDWALNIADDFVSNNSYAIITVDDVFNAYAQTISNIRYQNMQLIKNRRISFWIGLGVWAGVMLLAALITFGSGFVFFPMYTYAGSGFFKNVGYAFVFFMGISLLEGLCVYITHTEDLAKFLLKIPVFPRGLCPMIIVYWLFGCGYADGLGSYSIPFYIFGISMIVFSVAIDFIDNFVKYNYLDLNSLYGFSGSILKKRFISKHRGSVMFSSLLSCVPIINLFLFTFSFAYLHIVSVWIVCILLVLATLVAIILVVLEDGNGVHEYKFGE